jgi:hypothetical protein
MNIKILKNKRLQFVLAVIWLVTCFLSVRTQHSDTAYENYERDIGWCSGHTGDEFFRDENCINAATSKFEAALKITLADVSSTLFFFITPIIFTIVLAGLIKWINNYQPKN